MVLLAIGWIVAGGSVLGAVAAPAQAEATSSVQVLVGPNRTTGVSTDVVARPAAARDRHRGLGVAVAAGTDAGTSTADLDAAVEEGTTTDDLTAGDSPWWSGAWLLLAVPAGTALAWWISRPRGSAAQAGAGPLYS